MMPVAGGDIRRDGVVDRRLHLRGNKTAPDELVEVKFSVVEILSTSPDRSIFVGRIAS